jgi:hypothetical protein
MNRQTNDLQLARKDVELLERRKTTALASIELLRGQLYLAKSAPDRNRLQCDIQAALLELRINQEKLDLARRAVKALQRRGEYT